MRIVSVDIRCCRHEATTGNALAMRYRLDIEALEFLVYILRTDTGESVSMFGFAGRSSKGARHMAAASLRPFLIRRNPQDREAIWHDWRRMDRWWHHLPVCMFGQVDCCLWLLGAKAAGQPLWRYVGGAQFSVPVYASSLVPPDSEVYAREAQDVQAAEMRAYKIHPPGRSLDEDIAIHHAVRDASGPDFTLMSDPVGPYTLEQVIRLRRELEGLGYHRLEEPLPDENFSALRELTRVLDIPVVGTEALAKYPHSVAECIATRLVDVVRADVSWTGGVTGVLKTAHLAERFHMNCELHATIFHTLELANPHLAGVLQNNSFLEVLWPMDKFAFGLTTPLSVKNGTATLPDKPGLGAELDWDLIGDATLEAA